MVLIGISKHLVAKYLELFKSEVQKNVSLGRSYERPLYAGYGLLSLF